MPVIPRSRLLVRMRRSQFDRDHRNFDSSFFSASHRDRLSTLLRGRRAALLHLLGRTVFELKRLTQISRPL